MFKGPQRCTDEVPKNIFSGYGFELFKTLTSRTQGGRLLFRASLQNQRLLHAGY